jgi:GR25 family glycosyltransferase involved in LPS biosynthesis
MNPNLKYIFFFHSSVSSNDKETVRNYLLQQNNPNIYLFYDYPKDIDLNHFIDILLLFTDYDDNPNILFFSNDISDSNYIEVIKKGADFLEYQKMDYFKLKLITQSSFPSYTFYNYPNYMTPYHCLFDKKKYIMRGDEQKPYYLLNNYIDSSITLEPTGILIDYYVIHLNKRTDRKERFDMNMEISGIVVNYFEGVDGSLLDVSELMNNIYVDTNKLAKRDVKYVKGVIGCKMSHYNLLKHYSEQVDNNKYLCIFEDDFRFYSYKNINSIIEHKIREMEIRNPDWTILYLSVNLQNRIRDRNNTGFELKEIPENDGLSLAGYIVNPVKINNIMELILREKEEIDVVFQRYLENRYYLEPFLGYQEESFSDIQNQVVHYPFLY